MRNDDAQNCSLEAREAQLDDRVHDAGYEMEYGLSHEATCSGWLLNRVIDLRVIGEMIYIVHDLVMNTEMPFVESDNGCRFRVDFDGHSEQAPLVVAGFDPHESNHLEYLNNTRSEMGLDAVSR